MTAKHILLPTDFSEHADHAVNYAIELAQQLQAQLTLIYVIHLTPLVMGDVGASTLLPYLADLENDAHERMQALLKRVHEKGIQGETAVVQGVPFQTIVDTAASRGIDLIIMGTHGRTGLTHALMGSVAEKVVRLAPCPVLVTRETRAAEAA